MRRQAGKGERSRQMRRQQAGIRRCQRKEMAAGKGGGSKRMSPGSKGQPQADAGWSIAQATARANAHRTAACARRPGCH